MKRKIFRNVAISSLLGATLLAIGGTLAWYSSTAIVGNSSQNVPVEGLAESTYFAYGDGTSQQKAYGIRTPRHLYNLAWLQYLGYFDGQTVYFELADDIPSSGLDMTGWTLPPIGTAAYPFKGYFDGNNKLITNLNVSDTYEDYEVVPSPVFRAGSVSGLNIVGMFGVVGNYGGAASYNNQVDNITDFTLSGATITARNHNTLAGIVAGYVNAPISNVGVVNSSIELEYKDNNQQVQPTTPYSSFNNISDYSIIGYCEDEFKEQTRRKETKVYQPTDPTTCNYTVQQSDVNQGWGGSINMKSMYDDLDVIWNTVHDAGGIRYVSRKSRVEDANGDIISETVTGYSNGSVANMDAGFSTTAGYDPYTYYNYQQKGTDSHENSYNKVTSSYGFVIGETSNTENFMCLTGKKSVNLIGGTSVDYTHYVAAYTIRSGSYYLTINNSGALQHTINSSASASTWIYADNKLSTVANGTTYYLNCSFANPNNTNTNLSASTTATTRWFSNSTHTKFYTSNGQYVFSLTRSNSYWTTSRTSASGSSFYITDGNGNYLAHSGNYYTLIGQNAFETSASTTWYRNNSGYFRPTSSSSYYLARYYDGSVVTGPSGNSYVSIVTVNTSNGNTYLRTSSGNSYYYLSFDGTSWVFTTTAKPVFFVPTNEPNTTITYEKSSSTRQITEVIKENSRLEEDVNPTFFPLANTNGVPNENNTGYLVSGSKYYGDPNGDIRVSKFDQEDLPNGLDVVYTINASGEKQIGTGSGQINPNTFSRYSTSKDNLQGILDNSNGYIYGLHFMDAQISHGIVDGVDTSVYVEYARVNGEEILDFELPTDCIDFNLKDKGFINFFGGSYFYNRNTGVNNSFFSLFEIQRNAAKTRITNMKEIVKVYSCNQTLHPSFSNIYEYSDGTFSVPFQYMYSNGVKSKKLLDDPSTTNVDESQTNYTEYSTTNVNPTNSNSPYYSYGYAVSFDADWIKVNTLQYNNSDGYGYAYYFEIPSNDGEYALGSVPNGVGAYLMYLDIGANAEKVSRTIVYEQFKEIEEICTYPKGVGMLVAAGNTVSDSNSYCIVIGGEYSGSLTMIRESQTEGKALMSAESNAIGVSYRDSAIEVVDGDDDEIASISPVIAKETTINRLTYYDFHPNSNGVEAISVIDTTVVDNTGNTPTTTTTRSYTKDGTTVNSITIYDNEGYLITNNSNISTAPGTAFTENDIILKFVTYYIKTGTIKIGYTLTYDDYEDEDGTYQTLTGYVISVVFTDSSGAQNVDPASIIVTYIDSSTLSIRINNTAINSDFDEIITVNVTP